MFGQSISRNRLISNTRGWENGTLWHRIVSRISPEKTLHRARGNIEEKKTMFIFFVLFVGKMHFRDWPLSALPIGCLERGDGRFHYWCTSFPPEFSRIIYYQKGFFFWTKWPSSFLFLAERPILIFSGSHSGSREGEKKKKVFVQLGRRRGVNNCSQIRKKNNNIHFWPLS